MLKRLSVLAVMGLAVTHALAFTNALAETRSHRSSETARCSPERGRVLVQGLVAAFNRGAVDAVDRMVAREPYFEWFAATGPKKSVRRLGDASKERATLKAYFRTRLRHHERWLLVSVNPMRLKRTADDMPAQVTWGKYDTVCINDKAWISVWAA